MIRNDIILYMECMKVGDRWKRTYELFSETVTRFFKWLYKPDVGPKDRKDKPAIVVNLGKVKSDKKTYKPTDMWTFEDNQVFFKYCPDKKIKCYHAIAVDTGARPHEILKLKIEDIVWPPKGGPHSFTVSGKTGSRPLRSLPRYTCFHFFDFMVIPPFNPCFSNFELFRKADHAQSHVVPMSRKYIMFRSSALMLSASYL